MAKQTYRVIQWATGTLGQIGIRHFVESPAFELAAVAVFNPDKAGKDAGELAAIPATGVIATNDLEAVISTPADCVFYAPSNADAEEICRLLRSGKNVVSSAGYFYPTTENAADYEKIEAACQDGGVSYFGSGIHPGYSGDLLPLVLSRLNSRVDRVQVYEVVNFMHSGPGAARYIEEMAFGVSPEQFQSQPSTLADSLKYFTQSMMQVVEGLGRKVEAVTSRVETGLAQRDIRFHHMLIPAGTVAAQHYEWTARADGRPLVVFHAIYTLGYDDIAPVWNLGDIHYRVVVEGDPGAEVQLSGRSPANSIARHYGYAWTAMACINAIPAVCDAKPGVVTHSDLGLPRLLGLVRPGDVPDPAAAA